MLRWEGGPEWPEYIASVKEPPKELFVLCTGKVLIRMCRVSGKRVTPVGVSASGPWCC
jgi:hypothetical protein